MYNLNPVASGCISYPFHLPRKHQIISAVIGMTLLWWGGVNAYADNTITIVNNSNVTFGTATSPQPIVLIPQTYDDAGDGASNMIWVFPSMNAGGKLGDPSELTVNVTGTHKIFGWTDHRDDFLYVAGGLRSLVLRSSSGISYPKREDIKKLWGLPVQIEDGLEYVEQGGEKYYLTDNLQKTGKLFSSSASGNSLTFSMTPGSKVSAKIFGGRNDFYGTDPNSGTSNNNTVKIELNSDSLLMAQIVFGGRSAQKEGANAYTGYSTDGNTIAIKGGLLIPDNVKLTDYYQSNKQELLEKSPELVSRAGIWGAEGYQTNHNYVGIDNAIITGATDDTRKFGIIGGRGFFSYRINEDVKKDGQSSISNNNIVVVSNSLIGLSNPYEENNQKDDKTTARTGKSFSLIGGYSAGEAKNNVVVAENSVVDGNVYGGFEFLNQLNGGGGKRELSANLVSLHNVQIENGSFYGTATGDTVEADKTFIDGRHLSAADNQIIFDETKVTAVNRRRGVAYLAGEVIAGSAYTRYIHFGEYLTNLKQGDDVNVSLSYYPTTDKDSNAPFIPVADSSKLVKLTNPGDKESINLGQLVGGSFLLNRKGFHSSLSPASANESNSTMGQHNFWVGAYTNLTTRVDGNGTYLNAKGKLFSDPDTLKVNHGYGVQGIETLSLLAHDDGMVYNYSTGVTTAGSGDLNAEHRPALLHFFCYHYDGRVLYLGVNNGKDAEGKDINAVGISFKKIEEFREDTQQRLNAFGNTFVGIFKDNQVYQMDSHPDGYDTLDWTKMTFEVPGFEVKQNGETVAKATYGFYKYLHFDGDDGSFKDKNTAGNEIDSSGKVTPLGQEGGVGLKYWLASLEVLPGKTLLLTGLKEDSELDNASGSGLQELFTLSANLEGSGNVAIAEDSTVIIGTPKTIYNIDLDKVEMVEKTPDPGASSSLIPDATKDVPFLDAAPNQFTGQTTVNPGAVLVAGKDGSLGSTTNYSSKLVIGADGADRATFYLQSHTQTVGGLTIGHDSLVSLTKAAQIADLVSASDPIKVEKYAPSMGKTAGELTVKGDALIEGYLEGEEKSLVNIESGVAYVTSENSGEVDLDISAFYGTLALKNGAVGYLDNPKALAYATADVQSGSVLYFDTPFEKSNIQTRAVSLAVSPSQIGFIRNSGEIYLSSKDNTTSEINVSGSRINGVDKAGSYAGAEGSVIHYRGLVQGPDNSQVDVIHSQTATGTSEITFGNHKDLPPVGVFAQSQGEKTLKENGIPVFIVQTPTHNADDLVLTMDEFGVKAKDNEAYKWMYGLGYNEKEDGSREWVLYNSNTPDDEPTPIIPPSPSVDPDLPNVPVLRPESGAYIANSEAWAKMHMRLHDRFGQAYYIDPFDGEEKKASGWVRQVGTHSHFKAGSSKTHARTAITQVGADLIRNEANEDWKYVGGVFAGGLYNRANTRSWDSAKSRSDGYSLGIYGTIYTGNSPDDGFYVDSWLLFGRYDNKVWGDENPGFKYKSRGWVWSVESGYTIPLSESGTKDYNKLIWTFQPEVQVVWDGVRASSVVDNTGTKYTQLGKDNVSIRVGARLHANYMNKGLGFIEGNWIHNTKNPGVRMTNGDIYRNGGRNVGEFRMGLEGHLSRNTLGWATVGVQAGKSGYHNETAQIGLRYMF